MLLGEEIKVIEVPGHTKNHIAFYLEINRWKNVNKFQLNIIDIKKHTSVIDLLIKNRVYKCQLTDNRLILITNTKGQSISSDFSKSSEKLKETDKSLRFTIAKTLLKID